MAAINPDKSKTLAALTSAALSLPGIDASAAVPAAQIATNVSYGHYQESDRRMQVDVYHADSLIPLYDRLELAFSLDRDTYSGATPTFSMPQSMSNQLKYKQNSDGTPATDLTAVDVVSAASGGVTAAGLTVLGGLNGFQSFADGTAAAQADITASKNLALTALETTKNIGQATLDTAFNADTALITAAYQTDIANLNAAIPQLTADYNADKAGIEADIAAVPATIANAVTVNFNTGMTSSSYAGFANNPPIAGGNCAGSGSSACYYQNNMVVGIVEDSSNPIAHFHRNGNASNRLLGYHSDSSGIYIRSLDSKAFSLNSMDFLAPISGENPDTGANDYWEILGFNTAVNTGLDSGDGTNYATRVAYQTVANGFNATLLLNSGFQNVSGVWIHYHGYPQTPADGKQFAMQLDNINVSPVTAYTDMVNSYNAQLTALTATYNTQLAALAAGNPSQLAALTDNYNAQISALTASYTTQSAVLTQTYADQSARQTALANELAKQVAISLYGEILNSAIPTGTPTVQRFQTQPLETRSMPQFTAKYYFDATTLALSGGLSDEPDFLSNFGSMNFSHEFNDKLTTLSGGYGITSNTIARNGSGHGSHHGSDPNHNPADYAALNEESVFHGFNAGIGQVLSKNTLLQASANFTRQSGYLSNPYKYVYVRGEITPEEYYNLWQAAPGEVNWQAVTNLEVVGLELFRENRPRQRNIWSFSNRINQHIPALDASVHFDYRFYIDDWNINSHTFELKWYQSLPWGLTVTPGIRYYSQSQAEFFAPYFLAPRVDGHYSSDFRLSAYGDLSGGVTVSKAFGRGIKLETGFEYVTHSGSLKLGGGGIGDYADFNYYLAHANLNIDLSAKLFSDGEHGSHHPHRHHGAPLPAGVMFGHMMNRADEIMIGYRYLSSAQGGAMLQGGNAVGDAALAGNACGGPGDGCLYKPTAMHMQMHMLDLMYAPTDWLNLMLMPQLMSMDMTMSEPIRALTAQENQDNAGAHGGAKHTSNDIGDTVITALVKVLDIGGHHLHAGLGASAPTGSIDAALDTTNLQDYGMQTGSGSWDFKPSLTYTGQFNAWSWGVQLGGVKRLEKNKYDFAYGDLFQTSSWGGYQLLDWLSASVRGVYTAQGRIQGESRHAHQTTATVDYSSNYGGRFWDVGFGLNAFVPEGRFAGHNLSFEWLQPVATNYNGYQLDRSGALSVSWNYAF